MLLWTAPPVPVYPPYHHVLNPATTTSPSLSLSTARAMTFLAPFLAAREYTLRTLYGLSVSRRVFMHLGHRLRVQR